MPTHVCECGSASVRISPERPEPQPMSRMKEGEERSRSSRARFVMCDWMDWIREDVVYLRASESP